MQPWLVSRGKVVVLILSLAAGATLFLAACGGPATTASPIPTQTPAHTVMVQISQQDDGPFAFLPATLTISVGTAVIWTNDTVVLHTVTSDTGVFHTPSPLNSNQTFQVLFTKPGTFPYHCEIHPYMVGTITVTP
jgi:plastocyanin